MYLHTESLSHYFRLPNAPSIYNPANVKCQYVGKIGVLFKPFFPDSVQNIILTKLRVAYILL